MRRNAIGVLSTLCILDAEKKSFQFSLAAAFMNSARKKTRKTIKNCRKKQTLPMRDNYQIVSYAEEIRDAASI